MKIICLAAFKRFTPGKTFTDIFGGTAWVFILFIKMEAHILFVFIMVPCFIFNTEGERGLLVEIWK